MKVGDEVRITWLDSVRQGPDWEDTIDVIPRVEPTLVRSYGVIIEAKKEYVLVAPHYGDGPVEFTQCHGAIAIPTCSIKKVKVL